MLVPSKAMKYSKEPASEMGRRLKLTLIMKTSSTTIYSAAKTVFKSVKKIKIAKPLGSMVVKVKKTLNGALPGTTKMSKVTRQAFLMLIYLVLLKQVILK